MKRKLFLIASLTIGSIASYFFLFNKNSDQNLIQNFVSTYTVQYETFILKNKFPCTIRTKESVMLHSEIVGRIIYMKDDGSYVKKEDPIIILDHAEASGKLKRASGRYQEEKLKLDNIKNLNKEGYKSNVNVQEQEAKTLSAKGEYEEAKGYYDKHFIKAPFSGQIGVHLQNLGSIVNYNTKLINISNYENIEAEFLISESEFQKIGGVKSFQNASYSIMIYSNNNILEGEFLACDSAINNENNSVIVRVKIKKNPENTEEILPGQLAEIVINFGEKKVLSAPESCIIKKDYGTSDQAFKVKKQEKTNKMIALDIPVTTGIVQNGMIEITSGVEENDVLISSGIYTMVDGQEVLTEE